MQPSLTGAVWGTKTARPAYLSSRVRSWSRSRFMNTPPESATVPMPSRAQISVAMQRRGARDGDMEVECEPVGGRSGFNSLQKCLKECFLVQNIRAVQPRWARCGIAGVVVGKTGDFAVQCTPSGGFELDGGSPS